MRSIQRVAAAALFTASLALPAAAQQTQAVTQADIQRLQDNVYLADRDVSTLRTRDASRATQLQTELDDLRDEVIYLRVKLRKERTLSRGEYADVRDRIEDVRSRARNEPATASNSSTTTTTTTTRTTTNNVPAGQVEIPSGQELDVRLQNTLNSGTAQVEDRFEATTLTDLNVNGRLAIPAGSLMRGVVTAVDKAGRVDRKASMTVSFDQVTINGRAYPMRGTVTQAIEGEGIKGDVGKAGAGAVVGGILGAVLGGGKGAVLGAVIGSGGAVVATEGKDVNLPQGSTLRVRFDSPLQVGTTGTNGNWNPR